MCTIARTTFFLTFRFIFFPIIHLALRIYPMSSPLLAGFFDTFLACHCLPRPLARTRVALRVLSANGQTFSVADPPVTIDITQASYILCDLPAKLAFHDIITVDNLRYVAEIVFRELAGFRAFFDARLFQNLL
jgi:hypothetical protein